MDSQNKNNELDEEYEELEEAVILNNLGEVCPKCGSGNYLEIDEDEFDDEIVYKLVCQDCGYESAEDSYEI